MENTGRIAETRESLAFTARVVVAKSILLALLDDLIVTIIPSVQVCSMSIL
jgi:hypothetical protein